MDRSGIPEGYHSVTPYIAIDGAAAAIEFYKQAFGAEELLRLPAGEKVGHAEIRIGDSIVMLSDEHPDFGLLSPKARGGVSSTLMIYVADVDTAFQRAVAAGASIERPLENQIYGDRNATILDPFGHRWILSTCVEELSPEEMQRRFAEA